MATALSYITYFVPDDVPVGTTEFDLVFEGPGNGYLSRSHIFLYINDFQIDVGGGYGAEGFTWVTDTRVSLKNYSPVSGDKIEFRRTIPKDDIYIDFVDRAGITETMLDEQSLSNLYLIHEVQDGVAGGVEAAVELARNYANAPVDYEVEPSRYSSYHWSERARLWAEEAEGVDVDSGYSAYHWSRVAKDFANEAEDVEVEPGVYSGLHWTAKANDEYQAAASEASDAADSATAADASETMAYKWAEEAEDVEVVAGAYSAKHHATKAIAGADLADDYANEAEDIEVEAGKYSAYHWAQKAASESRTVTVHKYWETSSAGQTQVTPGFVMDTNKPNVAVYLDGIKQKYDTTTPANGDFTFTSTVVTFTTALPSNDITIYVESQDVSGVTEAPAYADEAGDIPVLKAPTNYTLDSGEPKNINKHLSGIDEALVRAPGIQNYFVNGDYRVHNRGTSMSSTDTAAFVADMCKGQIAFPGQISCTREAAEAGLLAINPAALYQVTLDIEDSQIAYRAIKTLCEGAATLSGDQATISFYYRADAGTDVKAQLLQKFGAGGSAENEVFEVVLNDDGNWHKYEYTFTMDSTSGKTFGTNDHLSFDIFTTSATANGLSFSVADIKLESGPIATDIGRPPIQEQKRQCMRYYYAFDNSAGGNGPSWTGSCVSGLEYHFPVFLPVPVPEGAVISSLTVIDDSGGTPGFNVGSATIRSWGSQELNGFTVEVYAINTFNYAQMEVTNYVVEVLY